MKKFWIIISTAWQRQLAYRFTVACYRVGELGEVLLVVLMWSAIYALHGPIGQYNLPEMMTYILIGNVCTVLTRNYLTDIMTREIREGTLSLFLVKPMTYFRYALIRELGRVSFPGLISVITQVALVAVLHNRIIFNTNIAQLTLMTLMLILAFITELLISYAISCITFWTDETDGITATIQRLKRFVSGSYFPLSILPPMYYTASIALPFAYSFYVPLQLYLGKLTNIQVVQGIIIQIAWILALYLIIRVAWWRGIRRYEGVGI